MKRIILLLLTLICFCGCTKYANLTNEDQQFVGQRHHHETMIVKKINYIESFDGRRFARYKVGKLPNTYSEYVFIFDDEIGKYNVGDTLTIIKKF